VKLITLIVEFAVADISIIAWNLSLFDCLAILHVGFANEHVTGGLAVRAMAK
jgi:hypothetical protein